MTATEPTSLPAVRHLNAMRHWAEMALYLRATLSHAGHAPDDEAQLVDALVCAERAYRAGMTASDSWVNGAVVAARAVVMAWQCDRSLVQAALRAGAAVVSLSAWTGPKLVATVLVGLRPRGLGEPR